MIFHSYVSLPEGKHPFPMVFPWFSHGFPIYCIPIITMTMDYSLIVVCISIYRSISPSDPHIPITIPPLSLVKSPVYLGKTMGKP